MYVMNSGIPPLNTDYITDTNYVNEHAKSDVKTNISYE